MNKDLLIKRLKEQIHKPGVSKDDWDRVHPNLLLLGEFVMDHCEEHSLPLVFSSIFRQKLKFSKTDIHASIGFTVLKDGSVVAFKGRAFDISVKGWQLEDILYLVEKINQEFKIGAVSIKDLKEREAVFEETEFDENGKVTKTRHLHFQVAL